MKLFNKSDFLKLLVWALIALNLALLYWLNDQTGSMWGWRITDFNDEHPIGLLDIFAVAQFLLIAFTLHVFLRLSAARFNKGTKKAKIPDILVQCLTILIYFMVGMIGFVLLYDHSEANIIAASGVIGLSVGYVCRDLIADFVNSIVIQTDGLISIHNWIEINENGATQLYQVEQFDRRMVTLRNRLDYLVKIPYALCELELYQSF